MPLLLAGCSPEWYRENANNEVYDIVDQKRQPLVSEERQELAFSIEPQLVSVDEVGVPGELENFWGTPRPDPEQVTVDFEELAEGTSEAASPPASSSEEGGGSPPPGPDERAEDPADTVDPPDAASPEQQTLEDETASGQDSPSTPLQQPAAGEGDPGATEASPAVEPDASSDASPSEAPEVADGDVPAETDEPRPYGSGDRAVPLGVETAPGSRPGPQRPGDLPGATGTHRGSRRRLP